MAMHGMHGLETGRCIQRKTCNPTSHILSHLCDVRTDAKCVVFAIRARTKRNILLGRGDEHARGGRVCLDCSGKAWGLWSCSVCKVKQAACAFEPWLAQHRSCNGDQVCSNCWKCPIPRRSISKAVQRVAATQAKVARTAAEEKKSTCHRRCLGRHRGKKTQQRTGELRNEGRRAEGKASQTREPNRSEHRRA